MRPIKIALCAPGLNRSSAGALSCGLDFLSFLIKDRMRRDVEFFNINQKDVPNISKGEFDFLLVSFTAVPCITEYAKAVKFKKPPVTTLMGGPGVYCPGALVDLCDAVMVGRGEDAIFKALKCDYTGMMTKYNAFRDDACEIFKTSLLSPLANEVGCLCRCAFCQYSWGNVYASSCEEARSDLSYGSGAGKSLAAPSQEKMLKDLAFEDLGAYSKNRAVVGLDILTHADQIITRKPTSFALFRKVLRDIGDRARALGASGKRYLRLYCVAGYPWNPVPDFTLMRKALREHNFPSGLTLNISLGLCHFIPKVCTPLECVAVSKYNMRDNEDILHYRRPYEPSSGPFIVVSPMSVPGPKRAIEETILSRTRDPDDLVHVCRANTIDDLIKNHEKLIGFLDKMPAPWIKRVNDPRKRVKEIYESLHRLFPDLDAPTPSYPGRITQQESLYGIPKLKLNEEDR